MKIRKLIILFFLMVGFAYPIKTMASTKEMLNYSLVDNVWYTTRGGGKPYDSRPYVTYDMGGKTVFCIQPGVEILTNSYIGYEGVENSPYSDDVNKKIELIGYYGYDYPEHNTLRYRMATQALIWEAVSGQIVEYWTQASGYGDYINVDYEKNEIMKLVKSHNVKPSFDKKEIDLNIGEELFLNDENEVLDKYEVIKTDDALVRIENNKLYIKALKIGKLKIYLQKKRYDKGSTIIYKGEAISSQNVGYFRFSQDVTALIDINSYGKIELEKIGEVLKDDNEVDFDSDYLGGVEFSLYAFEDIKDNDSNTIYKKGDLIKSGKTNESGKLIFDNLLLGKYSLKETKTLEGYVLDDSNHIIELSKENGLISITLKNELEKTIIEVPDTGFNNNYILEILLFSVGIVIKLYAKRFY